MFWRIVAIVKASGKEFVGDHGTRLAAALSYYAVFSLVPLLFVVASIAGFILDDPEALREAVSQVTDLAGAEVGSTIESLLESVRDQRAGTLSIGLLIAAYTASNIFQQLQSVLAAVFHVPESNRRSGAVGWVMQRAIGVASTFVIAILVFTPIVAVTAIEFIVDLLPASLSALETLLTLGIPAVSLLMLIGVAGLTLQVLTPITIPWKAAVRGGATTAITGLTAASLVGVYLSRAAGTGTLGALGGAAILLFFFYLLFIVFVFGAEVTKVYADYLTHGDVVAPSQRSAPRGLADLPSDDQRTGEQPSAGGQTSQGVAAFLAGLAVGWAARRKD
ncbi:MAG: YihY/virulence factor BrkB family protein [Acidimicrobiia bacterium]|nr:YihY/virulence factor BrkB family protein [Acidimicrobiia bacterium]